MSSGPNPKLDAVTYLEGLEVSLQHTVSADARTAITTAKEACQRKCWHEMSTALLVAVKDPYVLSIAYDLHEFVLVPTRVEISPTDYVLLVFATVFSGGADSFDAAKGMTLVDSGIATLHAQTSSTSADTTAQCVFALRCVRALVMMDKEVPLEARRILDQADEFLAKIQIHELEPVLQALLSKARLREVELLRDFTGFYENVFECVENCKSALVPLSSSEISQVAYKASLAALLSPKIHTFGKLLHFAPLVESLEASSDSWLLTMIRMCNDGDVALFDDFVVSNQAAINNIPDLANVMPTLTVKVRRMALLHLIFFTPADKRVFSFDVLAQRCVVPYENVEPLLLSALALKLIDGKLDGLTQVVEVSWVQPRVLGLDDIRELAARVGMWRQTVKDAVTYVDGLAEEIPQ